MASFLRVVGIICDIFLLLVTPILVAIFAVAARKREALSFTLRGWLRFPVALVLTALCEFALGAIYLSVNPFVYQSTHRPLLIVSLASLAYLTLHIPITLIYIARPNDDHHTQISFQAWSLWWLVFALPTSWFISLVGILYVRLIFVALTLSLLAALFDKWYTAREGYIQLERERLERHPHNDVPQTPIESEHHEIPPEQLWKQSAASGAFDIPFVLLLGSQVALAVDLATNYFYSSMTSAYFRTTSAVILIMTPLAPFTHNFHRWMSGLFALVFIGSTILTLSAFPFTSNAPLRLHMTHSIDLLDGSTFSELSGPRGFFERQMLNNEWMSLPRTRTPVCGVPSRFHNVSAANDVCRWNGPTTRIWPYPPTHWVRSVETKHLGFTKGVLVVSGPASTHLSGLFLDPGMTLEDRRVVGEEHEHAQVPVDDGERGVSWERVFVVNWHSNSTVAERGGFALVEWDETPESGDVPDLHALTVGVPDWVRVSGPRNLKQPLVDGFRRFDF